MKKIMTYHTWHALPGPTTIIIIGMCYSTWYVFYWPVPTVTVNDMDTRSVTLVSSILSDHVFHVRINAY